MGKQEKTNNAEDVVKSNFSLWIGSEVFPDAVIVPYHLWMYQTFFRSNKNVIARSSMDPGVIIS